MKNARGDGDTVVVPSVAAAISSGDGVIVGTVLGVASEDVAIGEDLTCFIVGEYRFACPSAEDITLGAALNWDDTNQEMQLAAGDLANAGIATEAAGAGQTWVYAKINV